MPVNRCNMRCHYCYIGQTYGFNEEVAKSNEALCREARDYVESMSPKRLGGLCYMNFCANGETLLLKELLPLCKGLVKQGHIVSIVTNALYRKPLAELLKLPSKLRKYLFLKCSFHYLELQRLGLVNSFFDNIDLINKSGVSFSIELNVNDEIVSHITDIKELCQKRAGAHCHIIESRDNANPLLPRLTKLSVKEHQAAWSSFDSPMFDYQQKVYEQKRMEFCMAGVKSVSLNLQNGEATQCDEHGYLGNIFHKINFRPIGHSCPLPHCYNIHVYQVLCGNMEDLDKEVAAPSYAECRDRQSSDGSSWLTPYIKKHFSKRIR